MRNNKPVIGITLLLLISTILFAYKSFELNNQLKQSKEIIDSVKFSEFINLNNSIQRISGELMDYNKYVNEKELYLSLIGNEGLRLNQIGMNLRRLFNSGDLIYEEHIWKIEKFVIDISRGRLTDEEKIHQVAIVMDEQQKKLQDMFFSDNAIGVSGLNEEENFERIISILDIIVEEINEVNSNNN
jgi:hypothetical protein